MGKVFVILLLCLSAILHQGFRVHGEEIECFQCDSSVEGQEDCANSDLDVLDKFASVCEDLTPPETTTDSSTDTTTDSSTETTTDSSTETTTDSSTETTTDSSTETTTDSSTETTTGSSTETTTDSSTETTTDSSTETTTDSSTETTTDSSTETTTDSSADTTTDSSIETTTDSSADTTTDSSIETTTDSLTDPTNAPPVNPEGQQVNQLERNDDTSQNSPLVTMYTRQRRSLQREEESAPFKCYNYREDDIVRRGCTQETLEDVCTSARSDCRVCGTDRCNSGVKMAGFSLLMVVLGAVLFFVR